MRIFTILIDILLTCLTANIPIMFMRGGFGLLLKLLLTFLLVVAFIIMNVFPGKYNIRSGRYKALAGGCDLLISFLFSVTAEALIFIKSILSSEFFFWQYIIWGVIIFITCCVVFWNGIIRAYITSSQLRLRWRVLGIIFGMVPIINTVFLLIIIRIISREVSFEIKHNNIEDARKGQDICKLKYPLILVHGVFFRDRDIFNYWGRIPDALRLNGADIYYGGQQSALSVEDSARELAEKIKEVIEKTGAEKVNIIAHSKGGLDSRYAISHYGCDKYVASLTTVNTPHRGCMFVDKIFDKMSPSAQQKLADTYNAASRVAGDKNPDFLAAVGALRKSECEKRNQITPDMEGVFYQSVGSVSKKATSGRFSMDISYPLVKKFDGENDGLVSVESMKWGERFKLISVLGKRGVTHADIIDLNRENIKGFDVREYFVQLVSELREKGY